MKNLSIHVAVMAACLALLAACGGSSGGSDQIELAQQNAGLQDPGKPAATVDCPSATDSADTDAKALSAKLQKPPLMSEWAAKADAQSKPLAEYPRPQMVRCQWLSLNGRWDFVGGDNAQPAQIPLTSILGRSGVPLGARMLNQPTPSLPSFAAAEAVRVPFAIESYMSGIARKGVHNAWYRRTFSIPSDWDASKHIRLNFEAVSRDATVYVNNNWVGTHAGTYTGFSFDITQYLNNDRSKPNEIVVAAYNPLCLDQEPSETWGSISDYAVGKQCSGQNDAYPSVTGIYQPVWLEPVSATSITDIKVTPKVRLDPNQAGKALDSEVQLAVSGTGLESSQAVKIFAAAFDANGKEVGRTLQGIDTLKDTSCSLDPYAGKVCPHGNEREVSLSMAIPSPELWTPDRPYLYSLKLEVRAQDDTVLDVIHSYVGMRTITIGYDSQYDKLGDEDVPRLLLNGKFVFQYGTLAQGVWSESGYTAPTDEALQYNIKMSKEVGMNMIRIHYYAEPKRFYAHADRLGMLLWQDMPGNSAAAQEGKDTLRTNFVTEMRDFFTQHISSPSIAVWTPFNETWGTFNAQEIARAVDIWDGDRPVLANAWENHNGNYSFNDSHLYDNDVQYGPVPYWGKRWGPSGYANDQRPTATIISEFGGSPNLIRNKYVGQDYGYGDKFDNDTEGATSYYTGIMKRLLFLKRLGLSGAVYTQTTDTSNEPNGIATLDRSTVKMDKAKLNAAHTALIQETPESSWKNWFLVRPILQLWGFAGNSSNTVAIVSTQNGQKMLATVPAASEPQTDATTKDSTVALSSAPGTQFKLSPPLIVSYQYYSDDGSTNGGYDILLQRTGADGQLIDGNCFSLSYEESDGSKSYLLASKGYTGYGPGDWFPDAREDRTTATPVRILPEAAVTPGAGAGDYDRFRRSAYATFCAESAGTGNDAAGIRISQWNYANRYLLPIDGTVKAIDWVGYRRLMAARGQTVTESDFIAASTWSTH